MRILPGRAIRERLGGGGDVALLVAVIAVGQALGWLLAAWVGPAPPRLSAEAYGDARLSAAVSEALGERARGFDALAVAVLDAEGTRFATFGRRLDGAPVDPSTAFEIGSLTKALSGLLLADLIEAGRVEADTTLAEATDGVLTLEGEGAQATLARLARHRAGWPRLPLSMLPRATWLSIGARNPYAGGPDDVLRMGAAQSASTGEQAYSNLGFAALGSALAAHERTDYAALLTRRVLLPLGMRDTRVLGESDPLPEPRVQGYDAAGRAAAAWRASGWQATGVGVWSTAADLSRLATAVIDGRAPGQRAIEPPPGDGGRYRLGYGWQVRDVGSRAVLWHSGGTGGFRTWFGLSREDGRGVAVLSNTTGEVDALGLRLLIEEESPDGRPPALAPDPPRWTDIALVLLVVLGTAQPLWRTLRHLRRDDADRQTLVRGIASALSALALGRALVAWERVPPALWSLGAGFALGCLIGAALAWSRTPATRGPSPRRRALASALLLVWNVALVAMAI